MSSPWHGLLPEQWLKLWDVSSWRTKIAIALREVALDPKASPSDRLMSLQTINEAISNGALPVDPSYPELMRDVLLDVVTGGSKISFWMFWSRRHRKRMRARLIGARWMLSTAYQFLQRDEALLIELPSFS